MSLLSKVMEVLFQYPEYQSIKAQLDEYKEKGQTYVQDLVATLVYTMSSPVSKAIYYEIAPDLGMFVFLRDWI